MKLNQIFKIVVLSVLVVFWMSCTKGGGSVPKITKCCTGLDGNEVLSISGPQCSACCMANGTANPNPPKDAGCGLPKEKHISDQVGAALDAIIRGATALNNADTLTGNQAVTDTGVVAQAAAATAVDPGKKPEFKPEKTKNLLDLSSFDAKIPSNQNGGGGSAGGGFGSGESFQRRPEDPSQNAQGAIASTADGSQTDQDSQGMYEGKSVGSSAANSQNARSVAGLFNKGGIKNFDQGSDSAPLGVGRSIASTEDGAPGASENGDYFFRISRAASLFREVSRKYGEISSDWAVGDSKKAMR
jgi:hypothetical protein